MAPTDMPALCLLKTSYALAPLSWRTEVSTLVTMTSVLMSILAMLSGAVRSRAALHLGNLALRHRPAAAGGHRRHRYPDTILRWNRTLVARK